MTTKRFAHRPWLPAALAAVTLAGAALAAPCPAGADPPSADLSVSVTQAPNVVTIGRSTATYTIVVTNNGPDPAVGAVLVDAFGSVGIEPTAAPTTTAGSCDSPADSAALSCQFGTMAASTSVTVVFTGVVEASGSVTDTAIVASDTTDPNQADNTATTTILAVPGPSHEQLVVTGYYTTLAGRPPTATELRTGEALVDQSGTLALAEQVTATSDYEARWVDDQYERFLGRSAGPTGGYYAGKLATGWTYDQVVPSIVSSSEFLHRALAACPPPTECEASPSRDATNSNFVGAAYHLITGDAIPDSIVAADVPRLEHGVSRYTIAHEIFTSLQGRRKFVDTVTRKWLHRGADKFELYVDVHAMLDGERPEVAEASLLSAEEFWEKFDPPITVCCVVPDRTTAKAATLEG